MLNKIITVDKDADMLPPENVQHQDSDREEEESVNAHANMGQELSMEDPKAGGSGASIKSKEKEHSIASISGVEEEVLDQDTLAS